MTDVTRILVVEDDHLLRMIAVGVLEEEGFEVFEAHDGDAAVIHLTDQASSMLCSPTSKCLGSWTALESPTTHAAFILASR
ncbi:response regulator [Acidisoma cladoniae]|uniref:response regulator n=1 Tax=Acidisoma cladoniae TaxID=3040935 RepID=UPI002549F73F|nr:response regulator [Acidisoma sp. PAMC 29798]